LDSTRHVSCARFRRGGYNGGIASYPDVTRGRFLRHADVTTLIPRLPSLRRAALLLLLGAATIAGAFAQSNAPVLLVVGDSISAGYGLARGHGWVDLLAARLAQEGRRERVVNASISGDTTAGGRARLPALLREHRPSIVVIELGGNDALRGTNLDATRANLDAMVNESRAAHANVLLLGMQVPPNYGPAYARRLAALFGDVAKKNGVPLVPYLFEGFGDDLAQFQEDRIHPKAAAEPRILDNVWPALSPLLARP
jgi:acyl-CoA thioesterase-1